MNPEASDPFPRPVALFPLPNVVLFPFSRVPLHMFEARYRQLTRDVVAGDGLVCMGVLQPGWEETYYGNPDVHPIACVGRVHEVEERPDGRFDLSLLGLARVRILETVRRQPYRRVRVAAVPDVYRGEDDALERETARRVLAASDLLIDAIGGDAIDWAADESVPPGAMIDRAAGLFRLGAEEMLALLYEVRVQERGERLLAALRRRLQILRQTRIEDESDPDGFTPN